MPESLTLTPESRCLFYLYGDEDDEHYILPDIGYMAIGQVLPTSDDSPGWLQRALVVFAPPNLPDGAVLHALTLRLRCKNGASGYVSPPATQVRDDDWQSAAVEVLGVTKPVKVNYHTPTWAGYDYHPPGETEPGYVDLWDTPGGDGDVLASVMFPGAGTTRDVPLPLDYFGVYTAVLLRCPWGETRLPPYFCAVDFDKNESTPGISLLYEYDAPVGRLTLIQWHNGEVVVASLSDAQPLQFYLRDSSGEPALSKSPAVQIRKAGGSGWIGASGTPSELGHGWYQVAFNAADQDTPGPLLLRATASDCPEATAIYTVAGDARIAANLVQINGRTDTVTAIEELYGDSTTGGRVSDYAPTEISFTTDLASHYQDDFCVGHILAMGSGDDKEQHRVVARYESATRRITLETPLTNAPANGDRFRLVG